MDDLPEDQVQLGRLIGAVYVDIQRDITLLSGRLDRCEKRVGAMDAEIDRNHSALVDTLASHGEALKALSGARPPRPENHHLERG